MCDNVIELGAVGRKAVDTRAIGHIVIDRFWKGVGLLKHHADARAQRHNIDMRGVDILAIQLDLAFHAADVDGVIHPVERTQKR